MCCFLIVLGLLGPRLAVLYEWIFTNRVTVAFHGGLAVPLLGVIFLPWTTLLYTLAYAPGAGVTGLGWLAVALGVVADLSTWASGPTQRRRQQTATA